MAAPSIVRGDGGGGGGRFGAELPADNPAGQDEIVLGGGGGGVLGDGVRGETASRGISEGPAGTLGAEETLLLRPDKRLGA